MKSLICLLLAATAAAPAVIPAAAAQERVGNWMVDGEKGDCIAFTRVGSIAFMIISPASGGENSGGFAITSPAWTVEQKSVSIALEGDAAWAKRFDADGEPDIHGYWLPFDEPADLDAYPDEWQLRATMDGKPLADAKLTGFKAAVGALRACAKRTGTAS